MAFVEINKRMNIKHVIGGLSFVFSALTNSNAISINVE